MTISIIIPLYNKAALVNRALASVVAQRQPGADIELVVVDDGSTDDSAEVAANYITEHKHHFRNVIIIAQKNAGVAAARNQGVEAATGEFVAFLDADDEWMPDHSAALTSLVRRYPGCDVFATNYVNSSPEGIITPNRLQSLPFDGLEGILVDYFAIAAQSNPPLWTSALMVRRQTLLDVGGFPVGIKSGEDLLTWARLAVRGDIAFCTEPSAIYHRGHSNPRPPERTDEIGRALEELYRSNRTDKGLKRYLAMWYNMRMSRCLAHRKYRSAAVALCRSLRYRPTLRIAKPLVRYTLIGLR